MHNGVAWLRRPRNWRGRWLFWIAKREGMVSEMLEVDEKERGREEACLGWAGDIGLGAGEEGEGGDDEGFGELHDSDGVEVRARGQGLLYATGADDERGGRREVCG